MVGGKTGNRYYCAEVKDVNQNSDTFLVEFEDKKTQWVAANRVRQRATAAPPAWRPAANEKVEVKCFSEGPNDPMFWAEAEVLVDRGEDYYSLKQIGSKQVELVDIPPAAPGVLPPQNRRRRAAVPPLRHPPPPGAAVGARPRHGA